MVTRRSDTQQTRVVRKETGELPAQQDERISLYNYYVRNRLRFQIAFRVEVVATLNGFIENVEDVVEAAVQQAVADLEREQDCGVRIHSVFYTTIPYLVNTKKGEDQWIGLLGHILVEPIPGMKPGKNSGRRRYGQ